jgi:hypothetical protein
VHVGGVVAGHQHRVPAVAAEHHVEVVLGYSYEHCGVGDLVAVQVQHREHRAVPARVEEPAAAPGRGQRPRLRLAVADDGGDHEIWVVEGSAEGVGERVPELTALVDRAGHLGGDVARDTAGKAELLEQPLHARLVQGGAGIGLGPRASSQVCATTAGPPWPGPAMKTMSRSCSRITRLQWV